MSKQITGFIARSFAENDEVRLAPLIGFLKSFEPLGFHCQSAQPAEAEQVSEKIQKLIRDSDVFIGMFTQKYPVYGTEAAESEPTKWTAPSWVLQESGYALGNKRKMIFFVEPKVELPQLQGDFEYIEYDVMAKEKAFLRASEMITKIIAGALAIQVETVVKREEQAPPPDLTSVKADKPEKNEDTAPSWQAVHEAIARRDDAASTAAMETTLASIRKSRPKEEVFWKSWYQAERAAAGYPDSLSVLKKIEEEHPGAYEPVYFLAECQESFKNFQAASHEYLRAAQKTEGLRRSAMILRAAEALHKSEAYQEAVNLLLEELPQAPDERRLKLLSKLYESFKLSNRPYHALAIGEFSIFENGAQPDLHFNVGFDCGEAALNELAVFHYRSVLDQNDKDSAALNNLGVVFTALDLPIMSVQNHVRAAQLGNTLAAGNLAYKYLDAGMAAEATKAIQHALAEEEHDIKVDEAATEIKKRSDAENAKQKKIEIIAKGYRTFFREFGSAIVSPEVVELDGIWAFPFGEIPITSEGGSITGSAEKQKKQSSLARLAGLKEDVRKMSYSLMGQLDGRILDYTLIIDPDVEDAKSVPTTEHGYIIFTKEGDHASCLELHPELKVFTAKKKDSIDTQSALEEF
jgi:hypothetical protein